VSCCRPVTPLHEGIVSSPGEFRVQICLAETVLDDSDLCGFEGIREMAEVMVEAFFSQSKGTIPR